ncbi:SpaH/EbpB family LPXTG-anchored major pilin [Glutamicibacter sp. BSL13]
MILKDPTTTGIGSTRAVTALCALLAALLIGTILAPAPAAQAALPSGPFTIQVHKYEQPEQFGDSAPGVQLDPGALPSTDPVAGATFTAKRVPDIDLATDRGQRNAEGLTPKEAAQRVAFEPVAQTATTDGSGNATLGDLPMGLYLVEESVVPPGYIGAAPFLVALPLTNPDTNSGWLSTVHVYPKNAAVGVALSPLDEAAVTFGDVVRWQVTSDIPRVEELGSYSVRNLLAEGTHLHGSFEEIGVRMAGTKADALQAGIDYRIAEATDAGRRWGFDVEFTRAGLRKLEHHAGDRLIIFYDTRVEGNGEFTNEAILRSAGLPDRVSDTAGTKWGPLEILVRERGNEKNLIPGAKFELYLTPEDALSGSNPVEVNEATEWTTDAQGRIAINGLRFSGFVNGLERDAIDPLFREYYVKLTQVPNGWLGTSNPIALVVLSATNAEVAIVELWQDGNGDNEGGDNENSDQDELPNTGSQIGGALLLGALLLAGGIALVRRRQGINSEQGIETDASGGSGTEES